MSGRDTLYCENHPNRIAVERCEVCRKPLCAYCLYYTEDGQRLCQTHAEEARLRGTQIEEPGIYADQLIASQTGMAGKAKRGLAAGEEGLYKGNSNDVLALIAMLVGVISLATCCGGGYCLPLVGVLVSLAALLNAKKSYDPRRTRRYAIVGLLMSGVWVVIVAGCIALYGLSLSTALGNLSNPNIYVNTISWSAGGTATPAPSPTQTVPASPDASPPVQMTETPQP